MRYLVVREERNHRPWIYFLMFYARSRLHVQIWPACGTSSSWMGQKMQNCAQSPLQNCLSISTVEPLIAFVLVPRKCSSFERHESVKMWTHMNGQRKTLCIKLEPSFCFVPQQSAIQWSLDLFRFFLPVIE